MKNLINVTRWKQIKAYIASKMFKADTLILINRYGRNYTCYFMERDGRVFLRIGGELNTLIPVKKSVYKAIQEREKWSWKPVFIILKFLGYTRKNGLFEVGLIFKVPSKRISIEDIREALSENRLSVISVDINAIHGVYFGVFRFQDGELKLIKVMKVNVDWHLLEEHIKRITELKNKLRSRGLRSKEFRELRQLERRIGNLVQYPKYRGIGVLRKLIRGEQSLGRVVVIAVEDIDERDIEEMYNHSSRINRAIHLFMQGWRKRIEFLCRIEGAYFTVVDKKYSSKQCPRCKKKMREIKHTRWLYCSYCGKKRHRDLVALQNLALRTIKKIQKT